ncbi:MAG TPA: hypothetical protein VLL54_20020 [Pyrinomonadaceae bacterium]|nr:hypothetical protein [Pyrinomonadaceae bacterium]
MSRSYKTLMMSVVLLALVAATACTRQSKVQVGSHVVTIGRHGFEKKLEFHDRAPVPFLDYAGVSADGHGLKVSIKGDRVWINDKDAGQLRPGDSVFIGDEGVGVNTLDYGESAKYLRENGSVTETSELR